MHDAIIPDGKKSKSPRTSVATQDMRNNVPETKPFSEAMISADGRTDGQTGLYFLPSAFLVALVRSFIMM